MSLRVFHIVFVVVSIALSVFVTAWGLREYADTGSSSALSLAIVFTLCGVALIVYAGRVFRKLKDLS
ncbi:MAG TPA: hypothetical protein VLU46_10385 [Thermoanaerobaculia bacterium]|nr:hypothetical protein [Thermoanaerobaculia bacterium]